MTQTPSTTHYVYILRCADGTLYTGYSTDPAARENEHNGLTATGRPSRASGAGAGARYTRSRRPVRLIYQEACASRSEALRRESAIKKMTRAQKEALLREKQ